MVAPRSFMAELHRQFEEAGGTTAFHARVLCGSVGGPVKRLRVRDAGSGEEVELSVAAVVNAAGLHAQVGVAGFSHLLPNRRCVLRAGVPWCSAHVGGPQLPVNTPCEPGRRRPTRQNLSLLCRLWLPPCKACLQPLYRSYAWQKATTLASPPAAWPA